MTAKFNIQFRDGVAYVFAKTADTKVPATGETIKGDPQPKDLKAYSQAKLDPLKDPAIDQTLLGQEYTVVLPMTVTKVTDGYVVKNTATQIVNDVKKSTNTVTNPLKPINPVKDVVLKVNGDSVNGREIPLTQKFLYRLDSSVIPANRAYPQVTQWGITDKLDTQHDKYLGAWQVRANRDLYKDGKPVAKTGDVLAGTGFDNTELLAAITGDTANRDESGKDDAAQPTGEQLFTVDYKDGTITATQWGITDKLDTQHDKYLGAWQVRANRDLYKDGKPVAKTGDVLAGTGFDNTELLAAITGDTANRDESGKDDAAQPTGEQLFTVDYKDGTITANATDLFLKLVSADTTHEQAWSLFVVRRHHP